MYNQQQKKNFQFWSKVKYMNAIENEPWNRQIQK